MSVFVSGATGFIAQHIVNDLLNQGYKVIGTARSQEKADKLIRQFGNNPNLSMEIVSDIAQLGAFDKAIEKHSNDIKYVLHTASPFHFDTIEYEKDLLIPAVNGTKGILESIKKYAADKVERVVITSSFASVVNVEDQANSKIVLTEKDWNTVSWEGAQKDGIYAYYGSKAFAERAAWDFLKENRDSVKFKLTAVNPVYVFGPQLFDEDVKAQLNTSCEFINELVHADPETKIDASVAGNFIDVRDVSKAHLLAFQKQETVGERLILSNGPFGKQDIINVLNKNYPQLKGKIPPSNPDTDAKIGKNACGVNNEKSKSILGFKFMAFEETVCDTVNQILKKENKF
ncbi:hypothetical protein Kpol_1057p21 [Vanderwaltozyma polyspora DSM 70294]|uniref:NAD-dependent epimerase/dehydratase domain-containing protein n=1 Tax=Vanderwaltozyma polyspora (strain ATCC 22028 / DSM 70294 / BCRC 21397 / CBS 2163 / NBRC 10782 / NRRL Y-8283 / UCD 57-17) TaxID=436907 RepID=A7TPI9_VANPO|nr:uncharacterized protein Kpol_1057p21 [Vanderwaltozyma polyspora DSM 70294]EDO15833.1 hypothetical protein Kpol_1057p21 [Vanderwaltozyma polyspora DSM 70294]